MKNIILTLVMLSLYWVAFPQNVIRFCPGPGLNNGTDEGGLNTGKDAYVYDEQYSTNYGTSTIVATNPISTCNQTNLQAFMKFDLTTLPESVDSVFLGFNMFAYSNYCYSNCDNSFDIRYITTPWDEMTINWSNMPTAGLPFSDTVRITFPFYGGWLRLNITDAYNNWKSGAVANEGFTIYPIDGNCNNACVSFAAYSSDFVDDTTKRPYLEIFSNESQGAYDTDSSIDHFSIFPNPVTNYFTIRFKVVKSENYLIEIMNLSGQIIESRNIEAGSTEINKVSFPVSHFPSGIYIYRLKSANKLLTGRIIVNH